MERSFEFVVVGGGIAGICAALSAARLGIATALINDRDVPGGNASSEHRVHICGGASKNFSYYSREAGIADEIKLTVLHKNPRYNSKKDYHLSDMALYDMLRSEKNLTYFPSTTVYDCQTDGKKVTAVLAFGNKTGEEIRFTAPLFCDASGDGIVAYKAGCRYRVGREAKAEFGEALAPDIADQKVMGSCILFTVTKENEPVRFVKPDSAYDLVKDDKLRFFDRPETGRKLPKTAGQYNGIWWLEYGGENDTVGGSHQIDLELKKLVYGYWDYIKNSGEYPDAENYSIDWIAPYASKRESRRFIGPYIMKQSDIDTPTDFADAVATGGWSLDIHDVGGIYGTEKTTAHGLVPAMYNIPLSILYSDDIDNLFFAGRIVSATHVANGSLRVMETLGAMGQAVGTAAALCRRYNASPRCIHTEHISEVQHLLQQNGQYIIGRKEDVGLVRSARITSSAVKPFGCTKIDGFSPLTEEKWLALPTVNGASGDVTVTVQNPSPAAQKLHCSVYDEAGDRIYRAGALLKETDVTVPPLSKGGITLPLAVTGAGGKVLIRLEQNEALSLAYHIGHTVGAPSFTGNFRRATADSRPISWGFSVSGAQKDLYAAENVANGFARPTGAPNGWVSDGKDSAFLRFSFDTPVDIERIVFGFDAEWQTEHFDAPLSALVTDFTVQIETADGEKEFAVRDNFLSQPSLFVGCKSVKSVTVRFEQNGGADDFEVFSIKMF